MYIESEEQGVKAAGRQYHIVGEKGYWLQDCYGYTKKRSEAGVFSLSDMERYNLDGCTLEVKAQD